MTWTPEEVLAQERDKRVKQLQDAVLHVIKLQAIPPDEVCAALCGCIVYIVGLNTPQYKHARETIGILRRQMLTALTQQWKFFSSLQKDIARMVNGNGVHSEGTIGVQGGSGTDGGSAETSDQGVQGQPGSARDHS